jgi:hypothetical protein
VSEDAAFDARRTAPAKPPPRFVHYRSSRRSQSAAREYAVSRDFIANRAQQDEERDAGEAVSSCPIVDSLGFEVTTSVFSKCNVRRIGFATTRSIYIRGKKTSRDCSLATLLLRGS